LVRSTHLSREADPHTACVYFDPPVRLDRLNSRYLLTVKMPVLDQHLAVPSQGPTPFEARTGGERLFARASRCRIHFAEAPRIHY
jgi:hypothetical protein